MDRPSRATGPQRLLRLLLALCMLFGPGTSPLADDGAPTVVPAILRALAGPGLAPAVVAGAVLAVLAQPGRAEASPPPTENPSAWGEDDFGQIETGTITPTVPTPTLISGITGTTSLVGGSEHTLALKDDGTVWAWGRDDNGQLGAPTSDTCTQPYNPNPLACSPTPLQVLGPGGTGVLSQTVQIAGGEYDSLALTKNGTVWTGGQSSGSSTPVAVGGLGTVAAIALEGATSYALQDAGTVWAWGDNSFGELGDDQQRFLRRQPLQHDGDRRTDVEHRRVGGHRLLPQPGPVGYTAHRGGADRQQRRSAAREHHDIP